MTDVPEVDRPSGVAPDDGHGSPGGSPDPRGATSDYAEKIVKAGSQALDVIKRVVISAVVIIIIGLIAAAIVPRWWSQQLGELIDGSLTTGSAIGVILGFVCTLVPLMLLAWGFSRHETKGGNILVFAVPALLIALPNLATAWVTFGGGSGADAGRQVLNVNGPGLRGGTLVGALVALVVFVWSQYILISRRKAKQRLNAGSD